MKKVIDFIKILNFNSGIYIIAIASEYRLYWIKNKNSEFIKKKIDIPMRGTKL